MKLPDIPIRLASLLIGLLVLTLFVYSNYRAANMSMTIDESNNYYGFATKNIWTCFYSASCWGSANNHLLNTYLFQHSVACFGLSEWSIRFPNVLAHLLYLLSSWALMRIVTNNGLLCLTGFVLLNFNPFLLDFFPVARGYGLSMGFIMAATLCLYQYADQRKWYWVAGLFGFSFLAVMAVFTSLIFWFAAWGAMVVIQLFWLRDKQISWRHVWIDNSIPIVLTALLSVLLYQPVQWLQQNGEFNWGTANLYNTYYYLVEESLYKQRYIGNKVNNQLIFQIIPALFLVTGVILLGRNLMAKVWDKRTRHLLLSVLLLFLPLIIIILQYYILGSKFLVHRKSILFIPFAGLLTVLTLQYISEYIKLGKYIALGLILFSIFHLVRSAELDSCYEWWFDQHSRKVAFFFDEKAKQEPQLQVGVHWMFFPSLRFYRKFVTPNHWEMTSFRDSKTPNIHLDYFYTFDSEYHNLKPYYQPIDTLSSGILLLENRKRLEKK